MITITCRDCKKPFNHNSRGRPPSKCSACKDETSSINEPKKADKPASNAESAIAAAMLKLNLGSTKITEVKSNEISSTEVSSTEVKVTEIESTVQEFPFQVYVTNMGYAYQGADEKEAYSAYKKYAELSSHGFGQVGFERVTLYKDKVIVSNYNPKNRVD